MISQVKNNTIAIIVTYYPNIEFLLENIFLLLIQVNQVVVIDNSESSESLIQSLEGINKVVLFVNQNQGGIAGGLNIGLKYAWEQGFEFALLLDQDSKPNSDLVQKLSEGFDENLKEVAIVCPKIVDVNCGHNENYLLPQQKFIKVFVCITSGSLLNLNLVKKVGRFNEKFFIDYVDFEYCLRIQDLKFKILKSQQAYLYHSLGRIEKHHVMGINFFPTNHNSIRRYYKSRNGAFLVKKNLIKNFSFSLKIFYKNISDVLEVVFFEEDKFKKISSIIKGIIDGLITQLD